MHSKFSREFSFAIKKFQMWARFCFCLKKLLAIFSIDSKNFKVNFSAAVGTRLV